MIARRWIVSFAAGFLAVQTLVVLAQTPPGAPGGAQQAPPPAPGAPAAPAPPRATPIATVGSRTVTREDLDRRTELALGEFSRRNNNAALPPEVHDMARRQVLEGLIRLQLLTLEAGRLGIQSTPSEADLVLRQDPFFNPAGKFDESRYMSVRTGQPAAYNAAILALQGQLSARKLNDKLTNQFAPAEAALRSQIGRELSHATIDDLGLRRQEFAGTYPEPREGDLLDYYRAHRSEYQRPDRATLTVAFVNTPGLTDSIRAIPGGAEAWSKRMRGVADSLLAVIRGGADFATATAFLGPRSNVVVTSDNFPGYWRGTPAQNAALFDTTRVGTALPEAIPALEGWLLVRRDEVERAHLAPLKEVAREIRGILRRNQRLHHDEFAQRELYAGMRDSLAAPGWAFRYAVADTSAMKVGDPDAAEIDRYYKSHLADYSSFDAATSSIQAKPLLQVRDEVRQRWVTDARNRRARLLADQVLTAWSAGRRDAAAEAQLVVRETPPSPSGMVLDTTLAGRALSDTIWHEGAPQKSGMVGWSRGWLVWQVTGHSDRVAPTFEQARPAVARALKARQDAEDLAGARALYDLNPRRFVSGNVIHFSRITVHPRPAIEMPLTRAEVLKWQHDHIDKYSSPELMAARHILIAPMNGTPEADKAAYERAKTILKRIQAGEDFEKLARENSDDPATKDKGGDLGTFGRGTMLDEFEKAAFALQPGEVTREPVHTSVGYHLIKCTSHDAMFVQPLPWIYTIVGADAASEKADRLAGVRADSILRAGRTPRGILAIAQRYGIPTDSYTRRVGETQISTAAQPFFDQIDRMKPGDVLPAPFKLKGQGFWIAWVDSITPPSVPTWDDARAAAAEAYRREAGSRALTAKRAELDSMLAQGWSFDSLAALWGGPERVKDLGAGRGLSAMGGAATLDSLLFGGTGTEPIPLGRLTDWVEFPGGIARVRVQERHAAPPDQVATRVQSQRAVEVETKLRGYFDGLKRRWPVRILDPKLRDVALATPTAGGASP